MKKLLMVASLVIAGIVTGCSREGASLEVKTGSQVTLQRKDGASVSGRLVEVKPEHVVIETTGGIRSEVRRTDIAALRADATAVASETQPVTGNPVGSMGTGSVPSDRDAPDAKKAESRAEAANPAPEYREVRIPAGTILPVELTTAVSSDSSNVEDAVRATLRSPITVDGLRALPAGTVVMGNVTAVERAARVKGLARVAFRFTAIDPPGDAERVSIRTDTVSQQARATKKQDAAKIGGGAVGGAIIGGIVGGGSGAAKGAAIGGAAGTGVVLSTRGKEVRLGPGARLSVRLAAPVTMRVPIRS